MITNFKQFNENLLVPRNLEGRSEKRKQLNIRMLSQEVIDDGLKLDKSFMGINSKFVKVKKINGSVYLSEGLWTEIPEWLKDVEILGSFYCAENKLMSLKNCPYKIGGYLSCHTNNKAKLELPDYVNLKGAFYN